MHVVVKYMENENKVRSGRKMSLQGTFNCKQFKEFNNREARSKDVEVKDGVDWGQLGVHPLYSDSAALNANILFLHMGKDPIRAGEIVVFNIDGREIPIVHRVIKVHERQDTGEVDVLTKGDNNFGDDRLLYAHGQLWLQQHHIMGRAVGFLPYVGWVTIIMTEKPIIKYLLIGALGLLVITSKE
ncbi:hypothetical protein HPP92_027886 [Vanilla planifolia]|uniref:Signal peptidase complex catalytic subunit SEC11 n=1 Tax=Vanilla planifolia TaxID=51239 RepID=A0A835U6V5_VANPL|nr:hypothetical protein HPP92_027886 [Vanilla planifolia]